MSTQGKEGGHGPEETVDLLVIGSGIAGCIAALAAAELGTRVTIVSRSVNENESSTDRAQGGIIYEGKDDSPELLAGDIMEAGCHIGFKPSIDYLSRRGPELVRSLLIEQFAVPFDRNRQDVDLTEEGAHSVPRIVHAADRTGLAIGRALLKAVRAHRRIKLIEDHTAIDVLTFSHHSLEPRDRYAPPTCFGAYVLNQKTSKVVAIRARETVLATGGLGQIYQHTTNPPGARGDGTAMAYRAGARMLNLEYIQFHPTALYHRDARGFLISESMRGEGGELITAQGEAFMKRFHRRGSLAPRDVVARAIHSVMIEEGEPCVYLDMSRKPAAWVKKRFPLIYGTCKSLGIDCGKEPIPVVPAAHYSCGGLWTDLNGHTNIDGLWAAGEVACTGIHGANRLASTSLLEGLVWGQTVGERATERLTSGQDYRMPDVAEWQYERAHVDPAHIHQDWKTIKHTMWNYVGLIRSGRNMNRARRILRELQLEVDDFYRKAELSDGMIGLRNGLQTALAVLYAASENRVSCGSHFRID